MADSVRAYSEAEGSLIVAGVRPEHRSGAQHRGSTRLRMKKKTSLLFLTIFVRRNDLSAATGDAAFDHCQYHEENERQGATHEEGEKYRKGKEDRWREGGIGRVRGRG